MDMKRLFIGLSAAFLLIGGVFAAGLMDRGLHKGGGWMNDGNLTASLGLDEDATNEEIRETLFQKRLEDLGLTEDDSIKELREAVKAQREEQQKERLSQMREDLGLSEDATEEEIQAALESNGGFGRGPGRGIKGEGPGTMEEIFGMDGI